MKIEIQDLEFNYDEEKVLENINLQVEKGEIVSLVGPNGSGKTTLLKCMNHLLEPTEGRIHLDEVSLEEMNRDEIARKIGYVPQFEHRNFPCSIFDAILMGRKPYIQWKTSKEDLEIVSEIIESLDLKEFAMRDLSEVSGGQKQKVLIGRALAQKPEILILDEPTKNLDMKHELEVLDLLKKQSKNSISVVMAMHDLNLAARYSDKIIMLKNGQIQEKGSPDILTGKNIQKVYGIKAGVYKKGEHNIIIPEESL